MSNSNKRVLSIWALMALVIGNVIGSGVFLVPSSLASFGSISIISWVLTAAGATCLALVFANLSTLLPKTGGPYAYCHAAYGEFIGFEVAYNYWLVSWIGNAAIAVALVSYLTVFFPALKTNMHMQFFIEASSIWLFTIINCIGLKEAGIVQIVTTVLKLFPLILIAVVGVFFIHPHYLTSFNVSHHSNFSALTGAAAITMWTFMGIESATVPAEAALTPKKNIYRATIFGTLLAAIVYILSILAIMGLIPMQQLAHSTSPFADAAMKIFGTWGKDLVAAGAVISCIGVLNGWILIQGQVPMAAARDNLFPKPFAHQNKNGSPAFALVVSSIFVTILLAFQLKGGLVHEFTFVILLATLASLIPYIFTAFAQIMLWFKHSEEFQMAHFTKSLIISILAFIYCFWAIAGAGQQIVYYGLLLFMSGIPIYVWMKSRRAHKTMTSSTE